ncbi:MAG: DUF1064 domain-containing protein [Clostridiales bacterium]|nr:DUF1064 domain-containing protein [Clostridiales bacterium]MBQ1574740.1 DUF1064 domain-containing protein [Clostridiales bacterium]
MNKYRNKKCILDGIEFDSKKEMRRYSELKLLERAGEISDLKIQVPFLLLPDQYEPSTEVYTRGENKGKLKKGKLIEKSCQYIADFTYVDRGGNYIVEDVKGKKTKEYIIKKKLMLYFHGVRIKET